jgi:FtsP/CotA-like multicopper oxidase with cupredoxin domain
MRITIRNDLSKATTIHWHGLHVPVAQDGVVPFSQSEIGPGQSYTYEFVASHAGTFMYHSHMNAVEQIDRGLYGPLIIERARPAPTTFDREFTMMLGAWNSNGMAAGTGGMAGMSMGYDYFTINGKAFPLAPPWMVRKGELIRVRIINISNLVHPMHLHGHDFTVVAKDGESVRPGAQMTMNTLSVSPGETFDVVVRADNPGIWVWHCHELHHTENKGVEPGGLIQVLAYEGQSAPVPKPAPAGATVTPMPSIMPGMKH